MLKANIIIVLILICEIECTSINRTFKVAQRQLIRSSDHNPFKFLVLLQGGKNCVGSIFSSQIVVTAMSCYLNSAQLPESVGLEFLNLVGLALTCIKINKAFLVNDAKDPIELQEKNIAILKLRDSVNVADFQHTSFVASENELKVGTHVIIVGYGRDFAADLQQGMLSSGIAILEACPYTYLKRRVCATNQSPHGMVLGTPVLTEENGKYLTGGFVSSFFGFLDGSEEIVITTYKASEEFIRNVSNIGTNTCYVYE